MPKILGSRALRLKTPMLKVELILGVLGPVRLAGLMGPSSLLRKLPARGRLLKWLVERVDVSLDRSALADPAVSRVVFKSANISSSRSKPDRLVNRPCAGVAAVFRPSSTDSSELSADLFALSLVVDVMFSSLSMAESRLLRAASSALAWLGLLEALVVRIDWRLFAAFSFSRSLTS